ncbi:MAG: TolC family protein [Planctomycetota bacterium]|jgi:outer membrane protein TolC
MKTDWSVLSLVLLGSLSWGCAGPGRGDASEAFLAIAEPLARQGAAVPEAAPGTPRPEGASPPVDRVARVTLGQAVAEALAHNRTVKQAELAQKIGVTFEKEARSALIPSLRGEVVYRQVDEPPRVVSPQLGSFVIGPDQEWTAALGMNFPIFAFGRHVNNYRASVLSRRQSEADREATEADIAAAVTAAAFDLLEAQATIDVAKSNEAALWQQVQDAQARFDAETVTKEAVLEADVQHARAKRQRERLETLVPILRMRLNVLLGRPAHVETEIVDDPATREPIWQLETLEREALQRRPELRAGELEVAAAERTVKAVIGAELGEVRGDLIWDSTDSSFTSPQEQLTLFLTLNLPIFTGGARGARIRRARHELAISRLKLRDLQAQIRTEVADTFREVQESFRDIGVADRSRDQAKESLRIQQEKFRNGRATSQEVLISTSLLTDTRAAYVTSLYNYNVALRNLHRARGADPELGPFFELAGTRPPGEAEDEEDKKEQNEE